MKKNEALASKINERAYQLYMSKGSHDGSDLDDWLQAEKEVLKESKPKKRTTTSSTRKKREKVKVKG